MLTQHSSSVSDSEACTLNPKPLWMHPRQTLWGTLAKQAFPYSVLQLAAGSCSTLYSTEQALCNSQAAALLSIHSSSCCSRSCYANGVMLLPQ
jgi:hypothetical protein